MAALNAMPMLVVNLGGEMLYILEQRLQAQAIADEKSAKVLNDVLNALFAPSFMADLFRPQPLYSNTSTRQLFERLAHSSIMKLNASSMDKLYDLMTMGFKYQVLSCGQPSNLLLLSLNHLDALRTLTAQPSTLQLLADATEDFIRTYKDLTQAQFAIIKQTLCQFLQDCRVKVSLFLQDGIQNSDGSFVLSHTGPLPEGAQQPGIVRYFGQGHVLREESFRLANSDGIASPAVHPDDLYRPELRVCKLGFNMYAKDRRKTAKPPASSYSPSQQLAEEKAVQKAARTELSLLASLIGVPPPSNDTFSINLFPDSSFLQTRSAAVDTGFITFDAEDADTRARLLEQRIGALSVADHTAGPEEPDLLDLMDSSAR